MSGELKACPFCECVDSDMPPVETKDRHGHLVICTACSAIGPTRTTAPDAVAAWNRRATATPGALDPATVAPSCATGEVVTTVRQTDPVTADYGEHFLIAHVSADGSLVGIDHPCDAVWSDVMRAHVALRDRINERIEAQDGCPFKPRSAALSPQGLDAKEGWCDPDQKEVAKRARRYGSCGKCGGPLGQCDTMGVFCMSPRCPTHATPSQRLDAATVERCAQIVEDAKPRNDVSDWTEFARDKNAILTGVAARIRALSPQREGEQ